MKQKRKYFKRVLLKSQSAFFLSSGCSLLLSFLSLTSCSFFISGERPGSASEGMNNANFILDQVTGKVVTASLNGLPEEIQIFYKACFRDFIHQDNTLQNSVFKIHLFEDLDIRETPNYPLKQRKEKTSKEEETPEEEECSESSSFLFSDDLSSSADLSSSSINSSTNISKKSCLKIRTDSSGCLNWTEVYPYYPVNQSVWFHYKRAFEGTGVNHGVMTIPMAVNPWLALDPSGSAIQLQLVDLRYHPVDPVDQKRNLVKLENKDIAQCHSCPSENNKKNCEFCEKKKMSLSSVIAHFEKKAMRPRLWIDELVSSISQEHIIIDQQSQNTVNPEHLQTLKQFKVCHLNVKENCDPPGRFFKVRLNIPLHIKVRNYRNEEELLPLTRGNYSLKAHLFLKDDSGENNIVLHRDMGFISNPLYRGSKGTVLNPEFYLHIPYEHYGLQAFLALKVQAEGELKSFFLPFESVFSFSGQLRSVIGRETLTLDQETFSFYERKTQGSLIKNHNLTGSWLKQNRDKVQGFRRAGWDIELNRFRFSEISIEKNKCPTPVDRTIRYIGEVCIIDPLTDKVVPNTNITIQRQDFFTDKDGESLGREVVNISPIKKDADDINTENFKEGSHYDLNETSIPKDTYRSDTKGCLQWVDELHHHWYNREKYFVRKMIFSKREWGFEGERMIAINPWHWGFVFFQDITQLGEASIRTDASRVERPQIVLHDFRSLFIDPIYTIDRWLGINIFQNILSLFRVRVDRPDNVSVGQGGQRPSAQDVRRGYYFLRFILVKSHTEEAGGSGNMVLEDSQFREQYQQISNWNSNKEGWKIERNETNTGQMMNTNLEYITHFDTYVQVRDSVVNAYINLLFNLDQFIFIGSNNRLIVQVFPTDPKYYTYYEDSCRVDPSRSKFEIFNKHELISQPFMGTFVPGDQRNWNIFKALNEDLNLEDLNLEDLNNNINKLNVSSQELEQFIKEGKSGEEHTLFTKLKTYLTTETISSLSEKSFKQISSLNSEFSELFKYINIFLSKEPSEARLSEFQQTKNQVIEYIDKVTSSISTVLSSSNSEALEKDFFEKAQSVLNQALPILHNIDTPPESLKQEVKTVQNTLLNEINALLMYNASQQALQETEKSYKKWFRPDISLPENNQDWSTFNMNHFAKDEGLKLITMDDENVINKFLEDLKSSANTHNTYYTKSHTFNEKSGEVFNQQKNQKRENTEQSEDTEWNQHEEQAKQYLGKQQLLLNNFELMTGDSYYVADKKISQMYLPDFSRDWLEKILKDGVHSGTLYTPEVMTFFHSLCGFWFDKFYQKYLEKEQLQTIYQKHLEHFNYYKGTLDFLKNQSSDKLHADLLQAMKENNLLPIEEGYFDQTNLQHSPFKKPYIKKTGLVNWLSNLFNLEEKIIENQVLEEPSQHKKFTQMIYENLEHLLHASLQARSNLPIYQAGFHHFFNLFEESNHPFLKCIANPFNFFHVEEKIIVGDIGSNYSDLKYEWGVTKSYNVQKAFDYAYSVQWSMSRSFSTSLGTGFSASGITGNTGRKFLNPFNLVTPFLNFNGVKLSSEWSTSRSDTEGNRRQQSLRFADESLYLQISHSSISIRLKKFRHCLVLRTKNYAFEGYDNIWKDELSENFIYQLPYIKSGLMICSQEIDTTKKEKPFHIKEDYFYIYQLNPGDRGQFQNPLNFRNRPFVISVRGITEMEKLGFLLHSFVEPNTKDGVEDYDPFSLMTNPYDKPPKVVDGTKEAIQKAKVWDKTGFYPGVYNRKHDEKHYLLKPDIKSKSMLEHLGSWLYKNNPFGNIRVNSETAPLRERGEAP